jgi:hypothetical protein
MTWPDMWGPRVREGKREMGTDSGKVSGPWSRFLAGPKGFPGSISYFFFLFFFSSFLFYFLYLFITFAFDIKMTSNQLLNFYKTQSNISEQ